MITLNGEFYPLLTGIRIQSSGRYSPQTAGFWVRAALCGIRRYMCGTWVLDVGGCSLVDEDVGTLLADLQSLECLILDGCQKL